MVSRLLMICSIACCGLVIISFALFAINQASGASKAQVASLNGSAAAGSSTAISHESQPRRFIDGAAHTLTSPFRSLLQSDSAWAVWIFSTVIALLLYGVGLGFLARVAKL